MTLRRRKSGWLFAALLLLMAGAFLMSRSEPAALARRRTVSFPRAPRAEEIRRIQDRQAPASNAAVAPAPGAPVKSRDPVLSALPRAGKTALVIEANAILHSPIGELLIQCFAREGENGLAQFRDESGIDLLTDLDRVAISEEGVIVSGNFKNARWDTLPGDSSPRSYGSDGVAYSQAFTEAAGDDQPSDPRKALGRWGEQMIVVASSAGRLRAIFDRLDGRARSERPAISEDMTYGEIYGIFASDVLASDALAEFIPPEQTGLIHLLRQAAPQVELHVDARDDVAIFAHVRGSDRALLTDLEKAIAGLLSASRLQAQTGKDTTLLELLDLARVTPRGDGFDLELALPLSFLQKQLGAACGHRSAEDAPRTVR
jgi:hypothetical protein